MKKILFLLLVIVFAVTSCKNDKVEYTLLGDGTPYYQYPEKLIGKVKNVTEKNYLALLSDDTYKKGRSLTKADRDSLGGWTLDFEATFDNTGDLISCNFLDENNKSTVKYEIYKGDNTSITGKNIENDTIRYYDKFKLDEKGKRVGFVRYRPIVDTMLGTFDIKTNIKGDTLEYRAVNSKGETGYKIIVMFNNLNQFSRSEAYDKDGVFVYANEVKYNDKGKISELIIYNKDNKIGSENYFDYEYDGKGNWTKAYVKAGAGKSAVVIEERVYTYLD